MMSSARARTRIAAALAVALVATLGGAAVAAAESPTVSVMIVRGELGFMQDEEWNGEVQVYSAAGTGTTPAVTQLFTVGAGLGSTVDVDLPPGSYKLRVVDPAGSSGWYDGADGADESGLLALYGWHSTATFASAATIDVDAAGNASILQPVVMTHPEGTTTIGGVVGRWSNNSWNPNTLFTADEHVFVELYVSGAATPRDTFEAEPGSGLYQFFDVPAGDYELRAIVGTADPEVTVTGPDDLVITTDVWHPGLPGRERSDPISVGVSGHWVAANFAIDDAGFMTTEATITGDLYTGGLVAAAPAANLFLDALPGLTKIEGYKWFLDDEELVGQSGATLLLPSDSAGKTVSVEIAENFLPAGIRQMAPAQAGPVVDSGLQVFVAPVPTVGGKRILGATLAAQPGTWTPAGTKTYQWYRDGTPITGATARQYVVVEDDLGTDLTVTVTGTKPGYATAHRTSDPVPVDLLSFTGTVPVVKGAARYDSELSVGTGAWNPLPDQIGFQWFRDGVPIDGAVDPTYLLGADDIGGSITVATTASRFGYATETRLSSLAGVVGLGRIIAPKPDLIGAAQVGAQLRIDTSGWTPADVAISYRWQRGKATLTGFKDIPNATGATYTLTAADLGLPVRLVVQVTKDYYTTVDRTTAPTALVAASP